DLEMKATSEPASWEDIATAQVDALPYAELQDDEGTVTPFGGLGEEMDPEVKEHVELVRQKLDAWPPAKVADAVQRVRSLLSILAVRDVLEDPSERFLPPMMLARLREDYSKSDLIKLLTWIATHPEQGTVVSELRDMGVETEVGSTELIRDRVTAYAMK